MERIIRFGLLVVINLITAVVVILLTGGKPFQSLGGWSGIGALVLLLVGIVVIAWALWALGRGSFETEVLAGLVAGGTAAILLLAFIGLKWLMEPLKTLLEGGGIWWPIIVIAASAGTYMMGLSRQRRRRTR